MYHGDDEPTEVLHIYVVREAVTPPLLPIVLSVLALSTFIALSALSPSTQPVARMTLRVPAIPLPIRTFTAQAAIIPTGVKTYPATYAYGSLIIYNGTSLYQPINKGSIFTANSGVEVETTAAAIVPPSNPPSFGMATVVARVLLTGTNLAAFSINQVISGSVYVRNLSPFTGGRPAYSVKFATLTDKQAALLHARGILLNKSSGLHYPCTEHIADAHKMIVTWHCQFVNYHIPAFYHVTAVRLSGKSLIIDVWFIPRPVRVWVK